MKCIRCGRDVDRTGDGLCIACQEELEEEKLSRDEAYLP